MRVFFLSNSPYVRLGLASGFAQDGHKIAFAPRDLWTLETPQQLAEVDLWVTTPPRASIVIYEGLTGGAPIAPAALHRLKDAWDARFYYWAIEDPLWTHEVVAPDGRPGPYALVADHLFSTAVECVERYLGFGLSSSVLRFGCNPGFHRPEPAPPEPSCDVVLVANSYPARAASQLFELLLPAVSHCRSHALRCHIFGRWWDTDRGVWPDLSRFRDVVRGPLPYAELPRVYARARIVLGAEQCLNASATQSSSRIFEALGCGRCYVGPRHRAHAELFDDRVHACFTASAEETQSSSSGCSRMMWRARRSRDEAATRASRSTPTCTARARSSASMTRTPKSAIPIAT